MYGPCHGGPCDGRHMTHGEPVYVLAIDRHTKRTRPGMQRTPITETGYLFGEYHWESDRWIWSAPKTAVDNKTR